MYSTCLFCHADLGRNAVLEAFPVGRRLAYDPARGRLWVTCRKCERWNLSPLEERWEAIEAAERLYRGTKLRVSSDNIGLARVRGDAGGLELVRVGAALRPELAAWRYGDQFGRRRRDRLISVGVRAGLVGVVATALVVEGVTAGLSLGGGSFWLWRLAAQTARRFVEGDPKRVVARVPAGGSSGAAPEVLRVRRLDLEKITMHARAARPFALGRAGTRLYLSLRHAEGDTDFEGEEAFRVAGLVLPAVNHAGATRAEVEDATRLIEDADTALGLFHDRAARMTAASRLTNLAAPVRLALEMAAHEESERRAMEGELALLEAAWRDAERIARIADDLLVPPEVEARYRELGGDRGDSSAPR